MKTCCLINSYNYLPFLGEAIDSVLNQSRPVDQIVVVDDGSTDGSAEFLARHYAERESVILISQQNGGQLSCFNRGMRAISGDVVFFLDADDRFRPHYVARAVSLYERHQDVDFLSVADRPFGPQAAPTRRHHPSRDLGMSTLAAVFARQWVGSATSCISMRVDLARRVLPFPFEASWKTRADDVLVFGASVLGAHKYRLGESLVDYRVHGGNRFARHRPTALETMRYSLALNQLIAWYTAEMGFDVERLPQFLHREFRTIKRPSPKELRTYLGMAWRLPMPVSLRVRQTFAILSHGFHERYRPSAEVFDARVPATAALDSSQRRVA